MTIIFYFLSVPCAVPARHPLTAVAVYLRRSRGAPGTSQLTQQGGANKEWSDCGCVAAAGAERVPQFQYANNEHCRVAAVRVP